MTPARAQPEPLRRLRRSRPRIPLSEARRPRCRRAPARRPRSGLVSLEPRLRKQQADGRPFAWLRFHGELGLHRLCRLPDDGQPEAEAFGAGTDAAVETIEHPLVL